MKTKLPDGWIEIGLGEVLDYEQPSKFIVESEDYSDEYKTPVLTAGKSFILGYTNETKGVYDKLPVIIFDDFTTASKYVDFPFKVKSSAMKILRPKNKGINLKFIFLLLQGIKVDSSTHKRYYLSEFQFTKILLPPLETQNKIVRFLEKIEGISKKRDLADKLTIDCLRSSYFSIFKDKEKFEVVKLGDISNITMGGTPSTSVKEYWEDGNINWMKSGDVKGDLIFTVPHRITKSGLDNSNAQLYPCGTVVIALNGQGRTRGTTAILKLSTSSNQSVAGIVLVKDKALPEYVHFNLKFRYQELRNLTGDNDRSGLNLSLLRNLPIVLPPIQLQFRFANLFMKIEELRKNQKLSKSVIHNLFNSLMQKAFKGELAC